MSEHEIQVSMMQWVVLNRKKYPGLEMLYAVPNGGKRNKITASKLKLEGVKAGVWDLSLDYPSGRFHGLKIEVKKPGGRMSPIQKEWGEKYVKNGYALMIVNNLEDFINGIKVYMHAHCETTKKILEKTSYILISGGIK